MFHLVASRGMFPAAVFNNCFTIASQLLHAGGIPAASRGSTTPQHLGFLI
jgi:hypothetical protein